MKSGDNSLARKHHRQRIRDRWGRVDEQVMSRSPPSAQAPPAGYPKRRAHGSACALPSQRDAAHKHLDTSKGSKGRVWVFGIQGPGMAPSWPPRPIWGHYELESGYPLVPAEGVCAGPLGGVFARGRMWCLTTVPVPHAHTDGQQFAWRAHGV